jgi:hypothetical protein
MNAVQAIEVRHGKLVAGVRRMPLLVFVIAAALSHFGFILSVSLSNQSETVSEVLLTIPGICFSAAIIILLKASSSKLRTVCMIAAIIAGWRLSIFGGSAVYSDGLFIEGMVCGAIGGVFTLGGVILYAGAGSWQRGLLIPVVGALAGAIALPAGFLFKPPEEVDFSYFFITFLIWQVAVGMIATWVFSREHAADSQSSGFPPSLTEANRDSAGL